MLSFANVFDLLMNEFAGLSRRRFSFSPGLPCSLESPFFGHKNLLQNGI